MVSVKGALFKESKPAVDVYINNRLIGKTNLDGLFISEPLAADEYKVRVRGWLPWQRRNKRVELNGRPQSIRFFI
ncbi:hypothetical protein KKG61_05110 [bacterium]|nr:hypothetical protein [bacterium]